MMGQTSYISLNWYYILHFTDKSTIFTNCPTKYILNKRPRHTTVSMRQNVFTMPIVIGMNSIPICTKYLLLYHTPIASSTQSILDPILSRGWLTTGKSAATHTYKKVICKAS